MQDIENLKYPIGKYTAPRSIDHAQIDLWIEELIELPSMLRKTVSPLTEQQLNTPYRPGGWTVRQVVHHLPDSHMNAYIRCKMALTEERPVIKPYQEDRWAQLEEAKFGDLAYSLDLLTALHHRWAACLKTLTLMQLQHAYIHPENQRVYQLDEVLGMYVWHGKHHLAQITQSL